MNSTFTLALITGLTVQDTSENAAANLAWTDIALPTASFDVVISCECFEHNPYWRETFLNMTRVLRPGGLFVLTCATTGRARLLALAIRSQPR